MVDKRNMRSAVEGPTALMPRNPTSMIPGNQPGCMKKRPVSAMIRPITTNMTTAASV